MLSSSTASTRPSPSSPPPLSTDGCRSSLPFFFLPFFFFDFPWSLGVSPSVCSAAASPAPALSVPAAFAPSSCSASASASGLGSGSGSGSGSGWALPFDLPFDLPFAMFPSRPAGSIERDGAPALALGASLSFGRCALAERQLGRAGRAPHVYPSLPSTAQRSSWSCRRGAPFPPLRAAPAPTTAQLRC